MLELYVFHDEARNSHKFWEVRVLPPGAGSHWVVERRWGRLGTRGQQPKREFFATEQDARDFAAELAASKQRGGYRRVTLPGQMKGPGKPQHDGLLAFILSIDEAETFTF